MTQMTCPEHPHIQLTCAACMGRRGGQAKSHRKQQAACANGRKGGRLRLRTAFSLSGLLGLAAR
jgi:hypothetical protein